MTVVVPHVFKPGEDAASSQVNENFNALVAAIEGIGAASTAADVYQAGVLVSTDWTPSAGAINAATGVIAQTAGGAAWLPAVGGGLVRTFTPEQAWAGLKPPVLPGPGGFVCYALELTASGAAAVLSVVSGAEHGTAAEALAAPPATSAGKVQIYNQVIKNVGGVYSFDAIGGRDRRPWALGASSERVIEPSIVAPEAVTTTFTGLTQRLECKGRPVLGTFDLPEFEGGGTVVDLGLYVDNVEQRKLTSIVFSKGQVATLMTPAAGSRLFTVKVTMLAGKPSGTFIRPALRLAELRPFANNGTA